MSKAKQSQTRRNRRGVESIAIEHNERGGVMLHVLPNVNRSYLTPWLVTLGAYGDYRVLCWARDYQGAVDAALEWASAHEPHLLAQVDYSQAREELLGIDPGSDPSDWEIWEQATVDLTGDSEGELWIPSWEIFVDEAPSREDLLRLQGRACLQSQGVDCLARRAAGLTLASERRRIDGPGKLPG
jgi:hypothetical protein